MLDTINSYDRQKLITYYNNYCNFFYNRTYPYTENNLYKFLEEMWNEFLIENSGHIKYDKDCYEKLTKYIEPSHFFIENLENFIKQYDQTAI